MGLKQHRTDDTSPGRRDVNYGRKVSFYLSEAQDDALAERLIERGRRSKGGLIREALTEYLGVE